MTCDANTGPYRDRSTAPYLNAILACPHFQFLALGQTPTLRQASPLGAKKVLAPIGTQMEICGAIGATRAGRQSGMV